jgi:hypothetical protein
MKWLNGVWIMSATEVPIKKSNIKLEIIEKARDYFDILLKPLKLTEEEIQKQTLEELKVSLDKINEAIQHPESFGTINLEINSSGSIFIVKSTSEAQFDIGILPILLERKQLILQRIRLLEGEKKIGCIHELIDQVPDEELKSNLQIGFEELNNSSSSLQNELTDTENKRMEERINFQERMFKLYAECNKIDMDRTERKAKVTQSYLEKESVATLIGGVLLIIIIFSLIYGMIFNIPSTDILNNALLLIMGYFFGQSASKSKNSQKSSSNDHSEQQDNN